MTKPPDPAPTEPVILPPAAGPWISVAGDLHCIRVGADQTGGQYAVTESIVHPGFGPPPHVHSQEDEAFHVISGEVAFYSEKTRIQATPGTFLHLPRGREHWYRNEGKAPARMLLVITPGGLENFFRKIGQKVARHDVPPPVPDEDQLVKIIAAAADYGIEVRVPKAEG